MLSWLTGPRITDVIEDLQTDPAFETTFIEPPETPAPHFAVKAIKHAFFGTPAPEDANAAKTLGKKPKVEPSTAKATSFPPPKEGPAPTSPSKQINGILMTPGTANKGRKTVSFGSQVMDNEGKKGNIGRSGIPNDCPGKFPSPWTPGTELKLDVASDKKPRTKLTEALYDARSTTQPRSGQKPKARDDSDITIDLGAPRSESGRYWKEQYETYARKSEKEVKQLVARQQAAKNYAKKKDEEATALINQLGEERKRSRNRERDLEQQINDLQEHLRKATAEKNAANMTIALLKSKIDQQKDSIAIPPLDVPNSKTSFQIFEDQVKDTSNVDVEQTRPSLPRARQPAAEPSPESLGILQPSRIPEENKENSPPKSRRTRRQTLPSAPPSSSHANRNTDRNANPNQSRPITDSTLEASALLARSLSRPQAHDPPTKALSARTPDPNKPSVLPPKSPAALLSSPLPQPSPEANLWSVLDDEDDDDNNNDNSPLPQKIDTLAFPISTGPRSYSRTNRAGPASRAPRHGTAESGSQFRRSETKKGSDGLAERLDALRAGSGTAAVKARAGAGAQNSNESENKKADSVVVVGRTAARGRELRAPVEGSRLYDGGKEGEGQEGHGSMLGKDKEREKTAKLTADRKEEARRRLMERRRRKEGASC